MALDYSKFKQQYGVDDPTELIKGFNLDNISKYVYGGDENTKLQEISPYVAAGIGSRIKSQFSSDLGYDPSQAELSSVFNNLDFAGLKDVTGNQQYFDFNKFLENPNAALDNVIPSHVYGGHIKNLQPKFNELKLLNDSLSKYGQTAPDELANQIIAPGTTREEAKKISSSYANKQAEAKLAESLAGYNDKAQLAIDQLDAALRSSSGKYFNETLQPSIEAGLNARGILGGGQLGSALSEQAAKLNTNRENIIAPLRYGASSGALNKEVENVMRQALGSGKSLDEAIGLANNIYTGNINLQNKMALSNFNNQNESELARQMFALQLALGGGQQSRSWEDWLFQALPVAGQLGSAAITGGVA